MSRTLKWYFFFKDFIQNIFSTFFSLIKVILLSKKSFKTIEISDKKSVILGNGPSLNFSLENNLDFISDSNVFCVNQFSHSDYFSKVKPKFYVILDPAYFQFDGIVNNNQVVKETFERIEKDCTWEMIIFMPQIGRKSNYLVDLCFRKPNIKTYYFNYTIFEGFEFLKYRFFNSKLSMPQSQNVMVAALYLALVNKSKEIYLFGADHSWHENIKLTSEGLMLKDVHFYDKKEVGLRKVLDTTTNVYSTMAFQFQSLSKAFKGYEVLRGYAFYLNAKVFNASKKTFIDAFPMIEI